MTTEPHPELEAEQQFVDRAYLLLDKGLADAERSMGDFQTVHRSTALALQRAMRILKESRGTGQLVFGRMRFQGEDLYIGRRRVRDENFDPVVVSWHAPAAQRFYEASPEDPHDLDLKRVFSEQDRRLVRIIDEVVAAAAAAATDETGVGAAFSDALLEELDRSRDGAMRDVVATIQSEQFGIIRAPLDQVVVVQGGPGTGKTVVGLHRAAWLAFNHGELRRDGVLVVAPSTTFLTYVSGVLPSLDVTDVDQVEVQRLYAGEAVASGTDSPEAERVKGSRLMAEVIARALAQRIGWGEDDLVLGLGAERILVPAADVRALVEDVRQRRLPHSAGREVLRDALAARALTAHREAQNAAGRPVRATEAILRRLSAFTNALDKMWPSFTPEELLRSLYGTQTWLARACDGVLAADERAALYRPPAENLSDEPWTEADLFCLDEAAALLNGDVVTYGHVIVDEAQDLSPMQARSLARRCPTGSFTVLGDLAQCTGLWQRDDWQDLTRHLAGSEVQVHTLSIGYRVPAPVLELAGEQLELAGRGQVPPRSIRRGLGAPTLLRLDDGDDLEAAVDAAAREHVEDGRSVAVLVPGSTYDTWLGAMASAGLDPGDGRDGDFSHRLTVVPASACKGLEFDVVVLVDPAGVAAESRAPHASLYVAMTRCTQALVAAGAGEWPAGILPAAAPTSLPPETVEDVRDPDAPDGQIASPLASEVLSLMTRLDESDLSLVLALVRRLAADEGADS